MQIILVGFGFYVLGDENLNGGTVMPAILKWGNLRSQETINIIIPYRRSPTLLLLSIKGPSKNRQKIETYQYKPPIYQGSFVMRRHIWIFSI